MIEIINSIAHTAIAILIALSANLLAIFGIDDIGLHYPNKIAQNENSQIETQNKTYAEYGSKTKESENKITATKSETKNTNLPINDNESAARGETTMPKQKDVLDNVVQTIKNAIKTTTPDTISEDLNNRARAALVNIICTTKSSGLLNPISGSGIIIDPAGIILTNAHIAQYFLLKNYQTENFIDCFIRTGSPAMPAYNAELLYISTEWIKQNAKSITQQNPKGTGENDFALLRIISSKNKTTIPSVFQYIEPDTTEELTTLGAPVLLAGYPAGFLSGEAIQKDLWQVTTITNITELFTFSKREIDLVSLNSNIAAQKGSSGGGVIHIPKEKLIGVIVTSTDGKTTNDRVLNAITLAHINRKLYEETRFTLKELLSSDTAYQASAFQKIIAPTLTKILINEIEK